MRPLADLMISGGVTLSAASELLKEALFDAARETGGPKPPSDSRISLLTGLHRKDVRRFREAAPPPARPSFANAASRLIALWAADPEYQDEAGRPAVLPATADAGPSFESLVARARADLAPGTIRAHLQELGLIEETTDGLRLLGAAYVPNVGSAEMLAAFEKNLTAHLQAAVDNLTGRATQPHFERAAHYNRLTAESAKALDALARRLAEEQLAAFVAEAHRLQQQDLSDPEATRRVSFGSFVYDRDAATPAKPDEDEA